MRDDYDFWLNGRKLTKDEFVIEENHYSRVLGEPETLVQSTKAASSYWVAVIGPDRKAKRTPVVAGDTMRIVHYTGKTEVEFTVLSHAEAERKSDKEMKWRQALLEEMFYGPPT